MSLLWADDFKSYGTTASKMLDGLYAELVGGVSGGSSPALVTDPDAGSSGTVLKLFNGQALAFPTYPTIMGCRVRHTFPSSKTTVGIACRIYLDGLPGHAEIYPQISLTDGSNNAQCGIYITTTGAIRVMSGAVDSGSTLTTSSPVITANAWHHIELKATISDTVGTFDVYVNGAIVVSLTGVDTKGSSSSTVDQVNFGNSWQTNAASAPRINMYVKDYVLWDTAGSINNTFFGPVFVKGLRPNSDVSFNWTASTGSTGYTLIDEASPDDADYISATVAQTTQSEFGIENLPSDVTSVRGVVLLSRMKASDGGDCKVQMGMKSSGSQGLYTDRQITTAFTYWKDVVEVSPNTGVQFTPTEFNNATFTIDRTT